MLKNFTLRMGLVILSLFFILTNAAGVFAQGLHKNGNDEVVVSYGTDVARYSSTITVISEDFENDEFPPAGWSMFSLLSETPTWEHSDWQNHTPEGEWSALHDYGWSGASDNWLVTPQIGLPEDGFYYLSFWNMVIDAEFYGKNSVLVSNGSADPADGDYVEVWTPDAVNDDWSQVVLNLEDYVGQDIYIAFRYEGDFSHIWVIDDVSFGEELDEAPIMLISTTQVSCTVGEGGSGSKSFKVINDGIQNLNYEIEIDYVEGNGWLTANPTSGSIPAKSSNTITLNFNATGLSLGEYHANITITSNDEENPTATVAATLKVMEAQDVMISVIVPDYTFPSAVSSDGIYVSGIHFGGGTSYLWTAFGQTYDFPGDAQSVSDNGLVAGSFTVESEEGEETSFAGIWNKDTQQWQFLGMNPEVPEITMEYYNDGYGISADGSIVVGMQWYANWDVVAFKWTQNDGYEMIGADIDGNSRANGISADGSVIYGWGEPTWSRTPVIWYQGQTIFIDDEEYGEAFGASANGSYVTGSLGDQGFIWSPTKGVTIFSNELNDGMVNPLAVLEDGTVFGYTAEGFPPMPDGRRAFVRHPNGDMETFNDYVSSRGWYDAGDWIFFSVNDVTPDANVFIGAALTPDGEFVSFVLNFNPGVPTIEISVSEINEEIYHNHVETKTITVQNVGTGFLAYKAYVQYTAGETKTKEVPVGQIHKSGKLGLGSSRKNTLTPLAKKENDKGTTIHYDGDNYDALGLIGGGTFYGAARFTSELTTIFENYQIESVDVYIEAMPTEISLMIWDAGTTTSAGELLYEQDFTPTPSSWNTITLESPVTITGTDVWVGFKITHEPDTYVLGMDYGPANANGDWVCIDNANWEHLADNGLNNNLNIRANLSFNGPEWLTIEPSTGLLAEGEMDELTLTFDAMDLDAGIYTANLWFLSNDAENPQVTIPVTLNVEYINSVIVSKQENINIYPNPATSYVNIMAEHRIDNISVISTLGKTIYSIRGTGQSALIDVSALNNGIYLIVVKTEKGTYTHKLQVN
ncbi:MAG TPA: choice-of-anchor J domain-containing protein [Tenuifilaceae bacterium]|jgi:hypothetical protein|nr:choice-of-anchor J domain-containing protein [Bacteroidales bacterium]MDI9517622.1 choice-of-anchor J domain-containing protein [Bacteroidota bacterium]OQC65076.1 MAG: hypothetical protein BWX49_00112 [Bacteroidetes bacterium ADurb.Bin008]HNV80568.1 choice-of-anchor J domain-containing protein [Tenuifilaceae bacterium]MZP83056.1 T9SS type A sorting domain-containing protein [Bacteroidales bacterium]